MAYTREELYFINQAPKEKQQEVIEILINKLVNNEKLTLAESKFICLSLRSIYSDNTEAPQLKANDYIQCTDFIFWSRYLLYFNDHEGSGQIYERDTLISGEQKMDDIALLEQHYQEWKAIINRHRYESEIIQFIASETKGIIQEMTAYCKQIGEGYNRQKHIAKSMILHSKYVYLQVREYYEELNGREETINIGGNLIVIDSFAYCHILFGHFAAALKNNRPGKTYHSNQNVDFRNIPKQIIEILLMYNDTIDSQLFDKEKIYLQLLGRDYAIWFRKLKRSLKGNIIEDYLRVQTFYPTELMSDLNKIRLMTKVEVAKNLSFYV